MSNRDNGPEINVVARLKDRLRHARGMGFNVRMELLDGEQATWCEIAGVPMLFVDLSQTAAEQLQQVEETLMAYALQRESSEFRASLLDSSPQSGPIAENRAA